MSGEVKQNTSVASGAIATAPSATESASDPARTTNPEDTGAEWHNTTTGQIFICTTNTANANVWRGQKGSNVGTAFMGDRAVWAGGQLTGGGSPSVTNVMQYNNMDSTGNSTDFGDLIVARAGAVGASGDGRGIFAGGYTAPGNTGTLEYINISSPGNALSFGALGADFSGQGASDGVRGWIRRNGTTDIYQWTISTLGDAFDWTNLNYTTNYTLGAGCSLEDRLFFGGGHSGESGGVYNYISYKSTLNNTDCVDFGDLHLAAYQLGGTSNGTYGFFLGGHTDGSPDITREIQMITIASTGNATDFGDLINPGCMNPGGAGRPSRCMVAGGGPTGGNTFSNIIQYFNPASASSAIDFGDIVTASNGPSGLSGD